MKKTLIIVIVILVIAGIVVAIFGRSWFGERSLNENESDTTATDTAAAVDPQVLQALLAEQVSETYTNDMYEFSLKHPPSLTPATFVDEILGADIVTIADENGLGMQIVITPFDEEITMLTVERIRQDQPDMVIRDPREVILGSSGKGVAFLDAADDTTAQRQIWFISGGNLYQITGSLAVDPLIQKMLNTWEFY